MTQFFLIKKYYKLAVKTYMKEGKDGFQMLTKCPILVRILWNLFLFFCNYFFLSQVDEEGGALLFTLIENYFKKFQTKTELVQYDQNFNVILDKTETWSIKSSSDDPDDTQKKLNKLLTTETRMNALLNQDGPIDIVKLQNFLLKLLELENDLKQFRPQIDGRIICNKTNIQSLK